MFVFIKRERETERERDTESESKEAKAGAQVRVATLKTLQLSKVLNLSAFVFLAHNFSFLFCRT